MNASFKLPEQYPAITALLPMKGQNSVVSKTNHSPAKNYDDVSKGFLPLPVKWGNSSRWPDGELDMIISAVIAGESEENRRALVGRLEELRPNQYVELIQFPSLAALSREARKNNPDVHKALIDLAEAILDRKRLVTGDDRHGL